MADVAVQSWRWRAGASPAWRLAVGTLAASGLAALLAWWYAIDADLVSPLAIAWTAASLLVVTGAAMLLAGRPVELRLDGAGWQLAEAGGPMQSVALEVALDLGTALLLRARPDVGRSRWLPVDRRALGPLWPALRRAVYSPRPAGRPAAADRPNPQE